MVANDHDGYGSLVGDVIQGIRSGNVETFREYVRGERSCDSHEISGPRSASTHRVTAPRVRVPVRATATPSYLLPYDEDSECDDEDAFMADTRDREGETSESSLDHVGDFQPAFEAPRNELTAERVHIGSGNSLALSSGSVDTDEMQTNNSFPVSQGRESETVGVQNRSNPSEKQQASPVFWKQRHEQDAALFAGGSGEIDEKLGEDLNIDWLFLPVRENGVFSEGVKLKDGPKFVYLHARDMLSHAYLKTQSDGVLHVLPGWDASTFIHDISYRSHFKQSYQAPIPFLNGERCKVRVYECNGVFVCSAASQSFCSTPHTDVDPNDRNILSSVDCDDPHELARKKVESIYMSLKKREEGRRGTFCGAPMPDPCDPMRIKACRGVAKLVHRFGPSVDSSSSRVSDQLTFVQAQSRCDYFIGCSEYRREHSMQKVKHYSRRLDVDNDMIPYLRALLSGVEQVSVDPGSCTYVREKYKEHAKCPRHGLPLKEVFCKQHCNEEHSSHVMKTFEPLSMANIPMERKVLYVSCRGEHFHPPPPPPEATVRKMQLVEAVTREGRSESVGKIRKMVQGILLDAKRGKHASGMSKFDGSLALPTGMVMKALKAVKPPVSQLAREIGELAVLAGDSGMPYVRDCKLVDGGYVFFLGLDEMFLHACTETSFAGDATFKTVTEGNRSVKSGRWYLYNIVAHGSKQRLNGSSVVVMRALMTGLTAGYYYAVWRYFWDSLIRARNLLRGVESIEFGSIRVPYLEFASSMESRSSLVTSITIDFDSAELQGCAQALRAVCGGSLLCHKQGMFIGCEVHLERDLLRRSRREDKQRAAGKSSRELLSMYKSFVHAKSQEEAEKQLEKVNSFDSEWVKWVKSQGMGPLISKCLSRMISSHRTIGFADTNAVESQNRRGNILVGTRLNPSEAARGLFDLDRVDAERLREGGFDQLLVARNRRNRSDSILRPVSSGGKATKKRSKSGGGPSRKRRQVSGGKKSTGKKALQNADKTGNMESGGKARNDMAKDHEREYEDICNRFQKGIALLKEKMKGAGINSAISAEQRNARLDTIVEIMLGVHAAASIKKVEEVKSAILKGVRSKKVDLEFREALFELYVSSVGGPNPVSTSGEDAVVMPASCPATETEERELSTLDSSPAATNTAPQNTGNFRLN